ncbi:MAG: thioredoxin family protein [Brevundimonas sp.]
MATTIFTVPPGEFDRLVLGADITTLVMFAGDCPLCDALEPALKQVGDEYGDDLRILTVDLREYPDLKNLYDIQSVPTLMIFDRGELRGRLRGFERTRSIIDQFVETHIRREHSSLGAFNGSVDVKRGAIGAVVSGLHPGWDYLAAEEDRRGCSRQYGLAPHLVALLAVAALAPRGPGSLDFLQQALRLIPLGADTREIARNWMISLWEHKEYGIGRRLFNSPAHAPAMSVMDLVRKSGHETVPREAWRAARSALNAAGPLSEDASAYARVTAAMGWDPEETPEICGDVWKAWEAAMVAEHAYALGWDQARRDQMERILRPIIQDALSKFALLEVDPPNADPDLQSIDLAIAAAFRDEGLEVQYADWSAYVGQLEDWSSKLQRRICLNSVLDACVVDSGYLKS